MSNNMLPGGVDGVGGKIKGGRMQTVPGRECGVGLPGTEMVEGELDEREKVRPAIRGERGMARREDSDNMVFGGADAALRGKGTMIVGWNILIGKERRFEKGSQIIGGFVVKK
jgi:hypothetical protein